MGSDQPQSRSTGDEGDTSSGDAPSRHNHVCASQGSDGVSAGTSGGVTAPGVGDPNEGKSTAGPGSLPSGTPWARGGGWKPYRGPPPWVRSGHEPWRGHHGRRRPQWLFLRFAGIFGLLALVLLGGLGLLIFLVVRLAGGDRQTAALLWLGTCGLLLLFPLAAGLLGRRAFRNIARPLSNLMDASERVAAGDLRVRVPVSGRGEFAELSRSFNRMVEELALADQRRRNLTADVAHELRTPLQIIQGNLEGVLDGVYAPTPQHLDATLAETRRLARLVEDLRLLSQAEAGQLPLAWETIDARALLEDIATSFSGQAQVAGVRLAVEVEDVLAPLQLLGDYGRLEQVIGNLAANALRHTPPGGQVTLRATASGTGADSQAKAQAKAQVGDEAGHEPGHEPGSVRLQVTDTGEGIAPEDLPFVFDRFWRGDRARTHGEGAGSGLGLAIARQLVQAHGGTIAVQSPQGAGTTFTLELPPVQ